MPSGGAVDISFTRPASAPSRPAPLVVPKAATNLPYGRVCDPINAVIEVPPLLRRQGNAAWRGRATTSMTVSMSNGFPQVWRRCWLLFSNRDKYDPNTKVLCTNIPRNRLLTKCTSTCPRTFGPLLGCSQRSGKSRLCTDIGRLRHLSRGMPMVALQLLQWRLRPLYITPTRNEFQEEKKRRICEEHHHE